MPFPGSRCSPCSRAHSPGQDIDGVDVAPARRVQAERYIRAHLADPRLNPDAIAAALHVSRRTLYSSVFAQDGGVAAYVRAQRLGRAHEFLTATALPVGAIAATVGLPNTAHFSRLFRATYGHSPRDLRIHTGWRGPCDAITAFFDAFPHADPRLDRRE